jgi:type VI secretion system ImpM family protein
VSDAVACCAGKLPIHGDFVRLNHAQAPEIVELDGWLARGIERAYERRGRAFAADLETFTPLRFVYTSSRSRRVLHGVLLPSGDQVGRTYPFVAGFVAPPTPAGPEYDRLPLAGADSVAQLVAHVRGCAGRSLPDVLQALHAIAWVPADGQAERAVRTFLLGTTFDAVVAPLPGFHAEERRSQLLRELWHTTQPPWPPRYLTTVPMRTAGEVTFWLALLRQWLPTRVNPVWLAWPLDGGGVIRWSYDELHDRYFETALWPEHQGTLALHLGRQAPPRRATDADGIDVSRLLRPNALLQDVVLAAGRL